MTKIMTLKNHILYPARVCVCLCERVCVCMRVCVHPVVIFLCIAEVAFLSLVGWMRGGIQGLRFVIVVWIA